VREVAKVFDRRKRLNRRLHICSLLEDHAFVTTNAYTHRMGVVALAIKCLQIQTLEGTV
jgi:hypothetical protein